jgi:hypothetical protein
LQFVANADVASVGVPIKLPPLQIRVLSPKWRLSPILGRLAGLTGNGWIEAVRVGDVEFVGMPGDFSGEISVKWKAWGAQRGLDLWPSGFASEYAGYISPDEYYGHVTNEKGSPEYETGIMSWTGPHQEGFFTALMNRMVEKLGKSSAAAATAAPQAAPTS